MLNLNLNSAVSRSSDLLSKSTQIASASTFTHIPLRLNTLLLAYDPHTPQSTLLIPYQSKDFPFISSMESLSLRQQASSHNCSQRESSLLFYDTTTHSMHFSPEIKGGYHKIGAYALSKLCTELDDSQRVYYYKLLMKFMEKCERAHIPIEFIENYLSQICKDVFNYDRAVGFQVISNFLDLLSKMKDEPSRYAEAVRLSLSKHFLSLFIMYKTWSNEKIRGKVLELIQVIKSDLREMSLNKEEVGLTTLALKEEIVQLEDLREHICIKDEIKKELRKIFS